MIGIGDLQTDSLFRKLMSRKQWKAYGEK
jgi:hypothetical protein